MNRRNVLKSGIVLAGGSLFTSCNATGKSQNAEGISSKSQVTSRRKLGTLEVSSIGLGVQNMSRKYETTIPSRPEMINIINTEITSVMGVVAW